MRTVRLHDGTEVSSDSEEWRHECEARAVMNMRTLAERRAYLYGGTINGKRIRGVRQVRGEDAVRRLEKTIMALWKQRKQNEQPAA